MMLNVVGIRTVQMASPVWGLSAANSKGVARMKSVKPVNSVPLHQGCVYHGLIVSMTVIAKRVNAVIKIRACPSSVRVTKNVVLN